MTASDQTDGWWRGRRRITVLNDTIGWMTPYCRELCRRIEEAGDQATLIHRADELTAGDVAFLLGCTRLIDAEQLALHARNLVVHASELPKGRGFSPLKWLVQEGCNTIPVTLLEAVVECDAGPIYETRYLNFEGFELLDEMQSALGECSTALCLNFLAAADPPVGRAQSGEPTFYSRRGEEHQRLDPEKTIAEQFHVLRTVDNDRFPAFFEYLDQTYELTVRRVSK